jgi:hypothetical protein
MEIKMTVGFPTNTVIWIVVAMIGAGAGSWFSLSRGLQQLPISQTVRRGWSWGAAVVLSAWLIARLALALNAPGDAFPAPPVSITFLIVGLLVGIVPLLLSPVFRQTICAIPETWLIGIHAIRVGGFFFLALMDMKLLPAGFAVPAGYGDMTVGLLALGVVYLLGRQKPYARALAIVWNLLGLLDFVGALTTGFIFIGPFAAQLAASGVSLGYLNYVFIIPTFGVPLFALLHLYSLFQLLSVRGERTEQEDQYNQFQVPAS